ncbi:sensor histidine kinase [Micromonospora sonneratiae]|uniref:histidine kinase n=1 Tax=Micromonospora sonneratiae TaxID=1184706 RepID=A0ABW3YIU5_9ACTN
MTTSPPPTRPPTRPSTRPSTRPAPGRRWASVAWAVLRWFGVVAVPLVLFVLVNHGANNDTEISLFRYVLPVLVMALPAGLLRRHPVPAMAMMLVAALVVAAAVHSWEVGYLKDIRYLQFLTIDLAVVYLTATRSRWFSIVTAFVALVGQAVAAATNPEWIDDLAAEAILYTLAMITAWMIGNSIRQRREHAAALRVQAATQAITAERLRIARELHDMVAHSIGIIAIQAGVGSRVIDTQPAEARNALSAIETTSRETLAGLRRMLGALRRAEPDSDSEPVPLDPTPGLADLDRLVASAGDAGIRVDVQWRGQRRSVPPDIDLSAYRIVQEAVTNVVRHAGTHDCRVVVDYADEELSVEVVDDGRGGAVGGTGYGIVGMRERVSLLHGRFTAGPRPEGGFRVTARLPLPTGAR